MGTNVFLVPMYIVISSTWRARLEPISAEKEIMLLSQNGTPKNYVHALTGLLQYWESLTGKNCRIQRTQPVWNLLRQLKSLNPGKVAPCSPNGRHFSPWNESFLLDLFILGGPIQIPGDRLLYRDISCIERFCCLPTASHRHHMAALVLGGIEK